MEKHSKALAFKCPGCENSFITDQYTVIGELNNSPSVMIRAACTKCEKKYIYYALREYVKNRKQEMKS